MFHPFRMQDSVQAGPSQASRPLLARCVKSRGFRHTQDSSALCPTCYFSLSNRHRYHFVNSHYLIIALDQITVHCTNCMVKLQIIRSVYSCDDCIQLYFNYLEGYYSGSQTQRRLPRAFHINGANYY